MSDPTTPEAFEWPPLLFNAWHAGYCAGFADGGSGIWCPENPFGGK